MLSIKFICVGKMKERFYIDAFSEYKKRLSAYCSFDCVEIAEQRLPAQPSVREIESALRREGDEIKKSIPPDAFAVALCVEGKHMPSEGVAELLSDRECSGKPRMCFIIGGSYGLDQGVKDRAELRLSMSKMTFPHHLARVMLAEQVYRGFKIKEGSKYHK